MNENTTLMKNTPIWNIMLVIMRIIGLRPCVSRDVQLTEGRRVCMHHLITDVFIRSALEALIYKDTT